MMSARRWAWSKPIHRRSYARPPEQEPPVSGRPPLADSCTCNGLITSSAVTTVAIKITVITSASIQQRDIRTGACIRTSGSVSETGGGTGTGTGGGGLLRQYISEDAPRPYAALKSCLISPLCSARGAFGGLAGALRTLISRNLSEKLGFCRETPENLSSSLLQNANHGSPAGRGDHGRSYTFNRRPPSHHHPWRFPRLAADDRS